MSQTRPFYWSVRRELWEHRSVYIAPLVVTAFALFGSFISLIGLPRRIQSVPGSDTAGQFAAVAAPLSNAPAVIMFTTFLVGIFYALDALYGERRDRSILFWKSMPVSDRTTVFSKASMPLLVLPLLGFVLSMATFVVLLLLSTPVLLASGVSPSALWGGWLFVQQPLVMLYGLTVHALWFAPIYSWLLLVSAWARRMPLLWATLPPLALMALERVAFNTSYFASLLGYRFAGAMEEAFAVDAKEEFIHRLAQLDPAGFLTAPGLWIGLAFAAAFLTAAVRLRRYREPI
jgi:ABC-2 type transport system permease protein